APFTLQGAYLSHEAVADAAAALGVPAHFGAAGFGPGERASKLAFAMHEALVRADATELERAALVTELLGETLGGAIPVHERRAVRRARTFLRDALTEKVTLDEVAAHAGLDKFRLVRAFRDEVGLPPYEFLTHARVSKARELLQGGAMVA